MFAGPCAALSVWLLHLVTPFHSVFMPSKHPVTATRWARMAINNQKERNTRTACSISGQHAQHCRSGRQAGEWAVRLQPVSRAAAVPPQGAST